MPASSRTGARHLAGNRGNVSLVIIVLIFIVAIALLKYIYTQDRPERTGAAGPDRPAARAEPRPDKPPASQTPAPAPAAPPRDSAPAIQVGIAAPSDDGGNAAGPAPSGGPGHETSAIGADAGKKDGGGRYRVFVMKGADEEKAESGMYNKEGSHITVKFDGGENAVAGHLIGMLLEEAYFKVGADLGYYPDDRIEAVLYSGEQFRDVTRSPAWAGAIYDGRIKIPAGGITEKTDLLEKVLFHEYTHALVHRLSRGRAPTWLNEGLAQHEEGMDESRHRDVLKKFAGSGKVSLRELEGSFMGLDAKSASAAYLLSLSATDYIIREFGSNAVKRIFEGLASGRTIDDAIRSAVYMSYGDLEKSWLDSLAR